MLKRETHIARLEKQLKDQEDKTMVETKEIIADYERTINGL